jgi:hypothetical protein
VKIVVYISGWNPDYCFNCHVKAHFTSPQGPTMHETVRANQIDDSGPWEVLREEWRMESDLIQTSKFLKRMDPVWVRVPTGQETVPADTLASVSVTNREPEWNCQLLSLRGFQEACREGL